MSQNDFVIDNQTTPLFRADLNNALQALASNSSGATEPSVTYANQFWYDESTDILKMRSEANDAWINIGTLNQSTNVFTPAGLTNLTKAQVEDAASTVFGQVSGQRLSQAVAEFAPPPPPALQSTSNVSRSVNVTYTNSLSRPILVSANYTTTDNQSRSITGRVNYGAGLVDTISASNGQTNGVSASITFVVPAGASWRANMPSTANTTQSVTEYR